MVDERAERAKRVAEKARDLAVELGADHVIVSVGYEDGAHHSTWRGGGLAIRGLLEVSIEVLRAAFGAKTPPPEGK